MRTMPSLIARHLRLHRRPLNLLVTPRTVPLLPGSRVLLCASTVAEGIAAWGGSALQLAGTAARGVMATPGTAGEETRGAPLGGLPEPLRGSPGEVVREATRILGGPADLVVAPAAQGPLGEWVREAARCALGAGPGLRLALFDLELGIFPNLLVDIGVSAEIRREALERAGAGDAHPWAEGWSRYWSAPTLRGRSQAEAFFLMERAGSIEAWVETGRVREVDGGLDRVLLGDYWGIRERLAATGGAGRDEGGSPPAGRVVVLAPHFDDEVIGCGGALAVHRARGEAVTIIYLTDGRAGDPTCRDSAAVEHRRKEESRQALAALGVADWVYLDEPETRLHARRSAVGRLRDLLGTLQPDVLYAPWWLENHVDHWETGRILLRAGDVLRPQCRVMGYEVWTPSPWTARVDITATFEAKAEALSAFRSQLAAVDYRTTALALARARGHGPGARYGAAEAYLSLPWGDYRSLGEGLASRRIAVV